MKRLMHLTAALAMAVAVSACAGDNGTADNNVPGTAAPTTGTVGTTGNLDADREFVQEHLAMGTAEIELGQLAQQRGTHADVKEFGATMVRDHQAAAQELTSIASTLNATGTAGTSGTDARNDKLEDLQEEKEELSKLSGLDFDKKYIEEMIDDHEEAIRDLENKAENAANAELKAWATKTLPSMRQHLERARTIKETLDRASNN